MDPTLLAAALGGALTGSALIWWLTRRRENRLQQTLHHLQGERDGVGANLASALAERERLEGALASLQSELAGLQSRHSALEARSEEREQSLREQIAQFEQSRGQLKAEFENLSREFLSARDKELRQNNRDNIEAILKPLSEKIEGFQHRVNQVHGDMLKNSSALTEQIRAMERVGLAMSSDATNLTRALKGDKKLVGNWGEAQLEKTLELAGLRAGEHYDAQTSFKTDAGQRLVPDFVIRLPEGKNLIIDSKVSLVDYETAISAEEESVQNAALIRHANAVKAHIDSLASKEYEQLPGLQSPDFVLMFMPVEPAYIEVMKHHRDLFSYGYQKGVIMVSHTTLMPILRTVSNLWMVERSTAEAREISDRAGDIFNSVCLVGERLQGLGNTLQTASKKYNDTVTALTGRQGLYGRVERFQQLSQRASRQFPEDLGAIATENNRGQLNLSDSAPPEDDH